MSNIIDMDRIQSIESSGDPNAFNQKSKARGLYQITPIVVEEWNNYHPKEKHTVDDLFDPKTNYKMANWYMNDRIPQMLRAYGKEDNLNNRLVSYNAGISYVKDSRPLPQETKDYIRKYGGVNEVIASATRKNTFSDAFRKARESGLDEFTWRGKRYTTELRR